MSVIRVLQVFTVMNRGGAESMIMNYYRNINRDKVQFDFLVHRKEKAAFDDEIESLGGKIFKIDPINPLFPGKYFKQLRNFFKEHSEYSIVHSHLNTFSSFPLKIAAEFNIPYRIAHAHIAIDNINIKTLSKGNFKEAIKKIFKNYLKRSITKYATHFFSCGDKAGKWLYGESTSFYTMNNAIDSKKFIYRESISDEYKAKLGIQSELILGHIGRFDNQKNHTFLLQIFADLLIKKSNCILILIGDGILRKKIELEAKNLGIIDKVKFLGVRTDIPQLLQMIDIFVFPSLYEGLPVTLIEAQAAGVKVFASDTITNEVKITNDIEFVSLDKPSGFWANKILSINPYKKKNNQDQIVKSNYDIAKNSMEIENFYLEQTHS